MHAVSLHLPDGPFYLHYDTTLLHGPNGEWHNSLSKPLVTNEGMLEEPIGLMDRDSVMKRITAAGLTENEAGYLWMDDSLGMLLDKLDELGIADNTIVLFVADHGSSRKGSLYRQRGTEVPCIMCWPNGMPKGVACDALVQNTDFVPTWFDVAGAKVPKGYKMDGVSIAPLFSNPKADVRDYVYAEMGASRAVRTKDWSYMALRFTKDQVEEMRQSKRFVQRTLTGLSGGISRGRGNPESMSYDQLYNIASNPEETRNLASNPEFSGKLEEMKELLVQELKRFPDRPLGEFIPGGKPNFVIVLADDVSWSSFGCVDSGLTTRTPNIDKLAAQGMRFENFSCSAAQCSPTRHELIPDCCLRPAAFLVMAINRVKTINTWSITWERLDTTLV